MNIAIFTDAYLSQNSASAVHARILALGLVRNGHKVLIITSDSSCDKITQEGVVVCCPISLAANSFGQCIHYKCYSSLRKKLAEFHPTVIHTYTLTETGVFAVKYAQSAGIPAVATLQNLRDADKTSFINAPVRFQRAGKRVKKARFVLENATTLTVTSTAISKGIQELHIPGTLQLLPTCVDSELFHTGAADSAVLEHMRDRFNLKGKSGILFVGHLNEQNGILPLLDQWAHYVNENDKMQLIVVGTGSLLSDALEHVRQLKITHQVTFVGEVPHNEMNACYELCSACISLDQSVHTKPSVAEAIACGLPVVLTKNSGSCGMINNGVNGFVCNTTKDAFAMLHRFSSLDAEGRQLLTNLVSRSSYAFTPQNQAYAAEEVYQVAVKSKA